MSYLSLSTFHHYTLTSQTVKELKLSRRFLDTRTNKSMPTEILLITTNFTFNQQHYIQILGAAMGTKMVATLSSKTKKSTRFCMRILFSNGRL